MFSQKKKRSKGWMLIIPFGLIMAAGLWLNSDISPKSENASVDTDAGTEIPIFEYNNNAGTSENPDGKKSDDSSSKEDMQKDSGVSENENNQEDTGSLNADSFYGNDEYEADAESENSSDGYDETIEYQVISKADKVYVYTYEDEAVVASAVTEVDVSMLPEFDRENLKSGIFLRTKDEVEDLLQNFEG